MLCVYLDHGDSDYEAFEEDEGDQDDDHEDDRHDHRYYLQVIRLLYTERHRKLRRVEKDHSKVRAIVAITLEFPFD